MKLGLDSPIPGSYYNIKNQKGTVTCINLSDENKEVTNTSELKEGDNNVKCSMIYENKEITSLTRTFKIDGTVPILTSDYTETSYTMTEKTNVAVDTLYTVTYGGMGGSTTCKNGSTTITNLNTLAAGSHTLICTAEGNNGKSTSVNPKVTVKKACTEVTQTIGGKQITECFLIKDPYGNIRYQGGNPNNYVEFGSDMYRIIGVFDGQMKLIYWGPKTAVGQFYGNTGIEFDPNASNGGHGTVGYSDWAQAKLKDTLNTMYWNTINSIYQNMVDQNHIWNIGGTQDSTGFSRVQFYTGERSSAISSSMSSHLWTGKVGLMYPSDYGYATNGINCDTNMQQWRSGDASCYGVSNNWLANTSYSQWTMTPYTSGEYRVFYVDSNGNSSHFAAYYTFPRARPVLYLKPGVKITDGLGTENTPYILSK